MYYSAGTYEAFAHPEKPKDLDKKSAYIIGTGLAGLTAAFYLVRDGQMKGEYVRFDIWNDGTVIPSERLESLDLEHRNKSKKNSVGLANVQARLKLMYGSDAQVQITSEPGKTCVSLIFTCKTYGEKE